MKTIKDVAKLSGVSIGTVSRVINGGIASKEAILKVNNAIKELNYVPNEIGRSLQRQNPYIVAFIVPNISYPVFSLLAFHLEKALHEKGYKLMICGSDADIEKEVEYFKLLKQKKVSGIINISYNDIEKYIEKDMKLVSIDRQLKNCSCITSDNYEGGRLVANYFVEKNYKNLAYMGSTKFNYLDLEVKLREQGFCDYLSSKKVPFVVYTPQIPVIDINSYMKKFFDNNRDIDALFVENDERALQCLDYANSIGKKINIVGFDSAHIYPLTRPISSVKQDFKAIAYESIDTLISLIEGNLKKTVKKVIPVTLSITS